jgi:nicotinamidase-related amidase
MNLILNLRTQVELFKGSGEWEPVIVQREVPARETALLLCDIWDHHWCRSAERRCEVIARRTAEVVEVARSRGVAILHAPSECMEFYADSPARRRMLEVPPVPPPERPEIPEPPLPIDDSDGGCADDPPCPQLRPWPWTRQHPAIRIADEDGVSDRGAEVYSFLQQQGIRLLLIAGVHTNMCVLKRTFAIRRMLRWGVPVALVRDLTDTMYNPRMRPFVPHDEGTALVIGHIERYLCPSVLSDDLLGVRGG